VKEVGLIKLNTYITFFGIKKKEQSKFPAKKEILIWPPQEKFFFKMGLADQNNELLKSWLEMAFCVDHWVINDKAKGRSQMFYRELKLFFF
jgi:hypothetical protein